MPRLPRRLHEFSEILRRKLYQARALGVGARDTVLDVGSGNAPNWRANFLCDKFAADATERLGSAIAYPAGRPFVVGDAMRLPFADQAFDFVVCAHVLEHVDDPERMLRELAQVARRGYLETPSRVWEKLHSWPYHRWLVSQEEGRLVLEQKTAPVLDAELEQWLNEQVTHRPIFQRLWMRYWEYDLALQYWWEGDIPVEVRRPGAPAPDFTAAALPDDLTPVAPPATAPGVISRLDATYGRFLRRHSQPRVRDWLALVACPLCHGDLQTSGPAAPLACASCGVAYPQRDGVPVLLEEAIL